SEGTPLVHVAIYCLPFFRRVVERGGDVNVRSSDGSTTLHALFSQVPANTETSLAIAELVYEKGGAWQINAADHLGRTPLMMFNGTHGLEAYEWLLDRGADVNAKDSHGETA